MGCGESKQAVATENTITKSKNLQNNPPVENPTNEDDNVKNNANENVKENEKIPDANKKESHDQPEKSEDGNENPSKKKDEKEKNVVDNGNKESGVGEKPEDDETVVVVEENIKGDGKKDEELKGGEEEKQLVVSNESPNKDDDDDHEETIESIISEGISGKSDYYSPRAKGKLSYGNDDHAEEKDAEPKLNKEKEEVLKVDEGKADETKSSGEEKISAVENETANAASTTDVKANWGRRS